MEKTSSSKLSDEELGTVAGGVVLKEGTFLLRRAVCNTCGWKSAWCTEFEEIFAFAMSHDDTVHKSSYYSEQKTVTV